MISHDQHVPPEASLAASQGITLLIHVGASVKTVQLALGRSNPTITLNTYVHEWPEAVDRTRSLIDGVLGGRQTAAMSAVSRA